MSARFEAKQDGRGTWLYRLCRLDEQNKVVEEASSHWMKEKDFQSFITRANNNKLPTRYEELTKEAQARYLTALTSTEFDLSPIAL